MSWSVTVQVILNATGFAVVDNTSGSLVRTSFVNYSTTTTLDLYIYDSGEKGGKIIDHITLAAYESARDQYKPYQLPYENGLVVACTAPEFEGYVTLHHRTPGEDVGEPVVIIGDLTVNVETPAGG